MGRNRRYKPKKNFAEKRREKQRKKDEWDKTAHRSYAEIIRENKDFEAYYKAQKIVPDKDDEWDTFIKIIRENLPTAFRITGSKSETKSLLEIIKGDFFRDIINTKCQSEIDNISAEIKPHCLPFYPEELAWQLQISRKDIRRSETFFKLHNFLIAETESGNISRQEVVSMVPPLVLDVKPWHKVLDMCASPGSKTAQLIEMIHADEKIHMPEGLVIANDLDNNRCYMLVHQAKRLNSPNILITNHDASVMPNFTISQADGSEGILKFDRILADVPCSGDGTMRKNPDIWCKWNPANGNNLHGIQYRIAKRGVELLAIGGKMVYSTCSLNPIENEGVLHRLLSETGDSVELVDCKDLVPGLIYNPGVSHWLPASKNLQYFKSWEDVPDELKTQIRPKMFPPTPEEAEKYHLERCMRILPHHQNTGGFFVAVLQKLKALPWESNNSELNNINLSEQCEENVKKEKENHVDKVEDNNKKRLCDEQQQQQQNSRGPQKKRKRIMGYREDPFIFFNDENEDVWPSIKQFYSISDELVPQCLLVRCREGKKKNIYFTSPQIRDIIISNEDKVKMINTGVKTFVRCDNKNMECAFRLAHEGLNSIIPYIGESRKIQVLKDDLILLLQNTDHHAPPEITKLSLDTQKKLENLATGSCVLIYEEENSNKSYPLKLEMVGWRGIMSLRAYVSVNDAIHYLRLLGGNFSMFEKNKFQINRDEVTNTKTTKSDTIDDDENLQEESSNNSVVGNDEETKQDESKEN